MSEKILVGALIVSALVHLAKIIIALHDAHKTPPPHSRTYHGSE